MAKLGKIILIILIIDIVIVGGYFGLRSLSKGESVSPDDFEWIVIDENYSPANVVEQFIQEDAFRQGILPVYLRSYDQNESVLKKFRGSRFAGPKEAELNMMFPGLEDWLLVEIKYKFGQLREREVVRAILYVMVKGEWMVGDSGRIIWKR